MAPTFQAMAGIGAVALLVGGLQGFISPSISALSSRAIDAQSQGELQGATQAVGSIAAIVGPPLYSAVFARFSGPTAPHPLPTMPLVVAAGFALVALALFWRGSRTISAALPEPDPAVRS
mgnify:CR=1 FL=1